MSAGLETSIPWEIGKGATSVNSAAGFVLNLASDTGAEWLVPKSQHVDMGRAHSAGVSNTKKLFARADHSAVFSGKVANQIHGVTLPKQEGFGCDVVTVTGISRPELRVDHSRMDNKEVRKLNVDWLARVVSGKSSAGYAALGLALDRSGNLVTQWARGHKAIGDKAARHIEAKLGKPRGWLDELQTDDVRQITSSSGKSEPRLSSQLAKIDVDMLVTADEWLAASERIRGVRRTPREEKWIARRLVEAGKIYNMLAEGGGHLSPAHYAELMRLSGGEHEDEEPGVASSSTKL